MVEPTVPDILLALGVGDLLSDIAKSFLLFWERLMLGAGERGDLVLELEVVEGTDRTWEISGAGGGGRKSSLTTALPFDITITSGSLRVAKNASSFDPNTLESSDFEGTIDCEPSDDLIELLLFLGIRSTGLSEEEWSSKSVAEDVRVRSSSVLVSLSLDLSSSIKDFGRLFSVISLEGFTPSPVLSLESNVTSLREAVVCEDEMEGSGDVEADGTWRST